MRKSVEVYRGSTKQDALVTQEFDMGRMFGYLVWASTWWDEDRVEPVRFFKDRDEAIALCEALDRGTSYKWKSCRSRLLRPPSINLKVRKEGDEGNI